MNLSAMAAHMLVMSKIAADASSPVDMSVLLGPTLEVVACIFANSCQAEDISIKSGTGLCDWMPYCKFSNRP